ncbi:TetR/AcrR family transcriptional regulator [Ruegeria sp. SCSIO 43209]|uniref:TetR/AcrR family transcriptional regulator n=1 Tax=Ruegeria sp. SCSIO 43209 TaxID=2793010 RepID=UPI001CA86B9C|nr:TetR/AcrR family transcriptional regulator [Ruegeria sp. SCSIO 43209]UAB88208.1 TetR/AcrR family transcriptional regulator [Ruegeria sp. SCSIO 43209]
MARKRKTDHDSAVAGALDLFWRCGYHGASTRELEQETGLTRFTLQTTYGGKEKFFLKTLDTYLDNAEARHFPDPDTYSLNDLSDWFQGIASAERMPKIEDAGCLAFNSISSFDRTDPEVNARIERYLTALEGRFAAILSRAKLEGAARIDVDPDEAAKLLIGLLLGLHTIMKARTSDQFPRSYADAAVGLINGWRNL